MAGQTITSPSLLRAGERVRDGWRAALERAPSVALLALPGLLVLYTAFNAGGFFAGAQAGLVVALALIMTVRMTVADRPFEGVGLPLVAAAGALGLLAAWTVLSSLWSHAAARALLEVDRVMLYLLVLLLFGSVAMTADRLRGMVRGLAAASVVVCTVALITRTLPQVWPIGEDVSVNRLSYPVTYWNALGLLGALGAIACLHLTCSGRERRVVKAAAAGALPLLAATVYFTLSRGAILAGILGMGLYLVVGRPRGALSGLAASVPTSALAVVAAYRASALVTDEPTGPLAVAQGRPAAALIALCAAAAVASRCLLFERDRRPALEGRAPRRLSTRGAIAAGLAAVLVVTALGVPGWVAREYLLFVQRDSVRLDGDQRQRLTDPSNNGRLFLWEVSLEAHREAPWTGHGAGSYQNLWNQRRPTDEQIFDAHSLYLEMLAELGYPGLLLVAVALCVLMAGVARRARGPDRALFAVVLALIGAWALRAGLDWDWEVPAVTLWAFALGGAALAVPIRSRGPALGAGLQPGRTGRLLLGLGFLLVAVGPTQVVVSQGHLNRATDAFARNDCPATIRSALDASGAVPVRPEPFELLGWCDARLGRPDLAVRVMQAAVRRDPDNWQYHYALALMQALAGIDPLPQAREAKALNPREPLARTAVERFATRDPRLWRQRAGSSQLPTD